MILAGGNSSRFGGVDKAMVDFAGRRLIEPVIELFASKFEHSFIVTNDPAAYLDWDLDLVSDIVSCRSSLTGIHAGLFYASTPYIFVSACDTPFVKAEIIDLLLSKLENRFDAVIPSTPAGIEPLFAVYARRSLSQVERHLKEKKFRIRKVFAKSRVCVVPAEEVAVVDPDFETFININTKKDLDRAKKIIGKYS